VWTSIKTDAHIAGCYFSYGISVWCQCINGFVKMTLKPIS